MPDPASQIKAVNRWTARVVPLILIGIVGYVTWVITVSISAHYLIHPPSIENAPSPRPGAAAAVLTIYYLLFFLMATTYFRLLLVVLTNPGLVEHSPQYYAQKRALEIEGKQKAEARILDEKRAGKHAGTDGGPSYDASGNTTGSRNGSTQLPSLDDYINREVFVCQGDGRPIFCSTCQNYKPDRSHHCREVGRCVRKMDHFCPWVGGIVSETSFKFFVQFVGWTAIYCTYILILVAILLHDLQRRTGLLNAHWIVTVALAGLFGLFTVGMFGSSLQFVLINSTTIENLSRKSVVYQLAIYMPRPPTEPPPFPTITYSTAQVPPGGEAPANAFKTFAILHTKPGENPWDLGTFANFKEVMGSKWWEWFLPLKYSPCTNHNRQDSQFAVGPVVERMRKEAGISEPASSEKDHRHRRRKSRRRHSRA